MIEAPPLPPTIELSGARLRALRPTDADAFLAYLQDPAVTALTSYPVITREFVDGMIERYRTRWANGELSKWGLALQDDDRIVGTCGFNETSPAHRWTELAFDLAQPQWGKGVMRQAVAAVIDWVFDRDDIDRVQAFVRVDNARSFGLLERSGFQREGCLRSYRVGRGQAHDFYVYSRLRSDQPRDPDARDRDASDRDAR